jgi:hypothetical protein
VSQALSEQRVKGACIVALASIDQVCVSELATVGLLGVDTCVGDVGGKSLMIRSQNTVISQLVFCEASSFLNNNMQQQQWETLPDASK